MFLICSFCPTAAWSQNSLQVEYARAQTQFKLAQREFDTAVKLQKTGAASDWEVRREEHALDLATIRLAILKSPHRKEELELMGAKASHRYWSEHLELAEQLAKRSSVSDQKLEQAQFLECRARLKLSLLEHANDLEFQKLIEFQIAVAALNYNESEYVKAERLYERGRMSKTAFRRAKFSLELARLERELAVKKIGAKASGILID
jgi:multidrug resistance efflux pump